MLFLFENRSTRYKEEDKPVEADCGMPPDAGSIPAASTIFFIKVN